jgi:hypothetical protein
VRQQPWLHSGPVDGALILAPPFVSIALVAWLEHRMGASANVPLWAWVGFILCVDVAHVYSTLFRTYLDPAELKSRRALLIGTPLFCLAAGVALYSVDGLWFWRALAYLAVFHFARQQYGFLMLYARGDSPATRRFLWLDRLMIYAATAYPILYWHAHLPRAYHWFIEGDFVAGLPQWVARAAFFGYCGIGALYLAKEFWLVSKGERFNVPKQGVVLGTALSWYVGIVALQGDLAFTVTNVVSHGLPYMGLIWIHGHKRARNASTWGFFFRPRMWPVFIGLLVLLGYLEEGLWDGLVWRDHTAFFIGFDRLPRIGNPTVLMWLVPLLALPQFTHYVLDGYIWKLRDRKHSAWQKAIL